MKRARGRPRRKAPFSIPAGLTASVGPWRLKEIHLPRLNGLTPTMESTALKLMEEAGELGAAIGKYRGLSGEPVSIDAQEAIRRVAEELLDVAQTAITMMFVLEESYGVDLSGALETHLQKLVAKGYLRMGPPAGLPRTEG